MSQHHWVTFVVGFVLPQLCFAQPPELKLPNFDGLRRDAVESVDVTLGPNVLGFASQFVDENDPQSATIKRALRGVQKVQVKSYRFTTDHSYAPADLEALRSQLAAPVWHQLVQVHDRGKSEDVDIYYALDHHTVTELAILAAEPRQFTVVNILGAVDLEQVASLGRVFVPGGHEARGP